MRDQEIIGLWEAYQQVHAQPQEEVEQLDEITRSMGRRATQYRRDQSQDAHMKRVRDHQEKMKNDPKYREEHERLRTVHSRRNNGGEDQKESVDLFDIIKEHLLDEGYADTEQAALVIMSNMSEEWRESIVEGFIGRAADNIARTAGTAVGTGERFLNTVGQKLRNVGGTFEYARNRARGDAPPPAATTTPRQPKPNPKPVGQMGSDVSSPGYDTRRIGGYDLRRLP